eukprot:s8575_g1.t1
MGYSRETFDPTTYFKRNQSPTEIPKVTGYGRCFLIRPPPTGPTEFLHIDPVGIMLTRGFKDTSADTIALLIDRNIQFPARYSDKASEHGEQAPVFLLFEKDDFIGSESCESRALEDRIRLFCLVLS